MWVYGFENNGFYYLVARVCFSNFQQNIWYNIARKAVKPAEKISTVGMLFMISSAQNDAAV